MTTSGSGAGTAPGLGAREVVELEGHIVDSLTLAKVLDTVLAWGGDYELVEVDIGRTDRDASRARLEIRAADEAALEALLSELQIHGANPVDHGDPTFVAAEADGVFPFGFYSTTNLPTAVWQAGAWREVAHPEMDCGIVLRPDGHAETLPMHRVRVGDAILVGSDGVRVAPPPRRQANVAFEFMSSEVSSERPKGLLVAAVAERLLSAKASGGRILLVCGPAVIHTGAGPDVAALVRGGFVDVLFAGNGFATHDLESSVFGTSLGFSLGKGEPVEGGHANHLRVINEIRRHGSIAAAVDAGFVTNGVMAECVRRGVPFVLAGSLRDDGPLPDVWSDVLAAADEMRGHLDGITVALMCATTLHAIATGNLLPATVDTYCVDINQAVATKLSDRGSHQALGIVTDIGLFLRSLAEQLGCPRP